MSNGRKLFEEVETKPLTEDGHSLNSTTSSVEYDKGVVIWLWSLLITLIFLIVVGGLTRLTDSGLSIVEWKPVTGIFPPLDEMAWIKEFEKYNLVSALHSFKSKEDKIYKNLLPPLDTLNNELDKH